MSSTTTTMYVNGTAVRAENVNWVGDASRLYLGAYENTAFLNGYLDDIRLYAYTFTADEVKALYVQTNK